MSVLSLTGVCLSFPRGKRHVIRVLDDVTIELDAGETVAVLAQRAQGKTSLLRVAAGIERPDRGHVRFEGEDLWGFSERRRSRLLGRQIGWVGSAMPDLDLPMLANVALPLFATHGKSEAYARATAALATEQGFAVLMSVSDAGATGWSGRVATLAGGELLETPHSPVDRGNIIDFPGAHDSRRDISS